VTPTMSGKFDSLRLLGVALVRRDAVKIRHLAALEVIASPMRNFWVNEYSETGAPVEDA
jgi:hypothetical protein